MNASLTLERRAGARPATRRGIPHQQLDQTPSTRVYRDLVERFLAVADTTHGPSLVSVPGARALFLRPELPCNCAAFMRGREFAHVHPPVDGSCHMVLSEADFNIVLEAGWGEPHPLVLSGTIPRTTLMVYAPRTAAEVELVLGIAQASRRYALSPSSASPR